MTHQMPQFSTATAAAPTDLSELLAASVERYAAQIDTFAQRLLTTVELFDRSACRDEAAGQGLWRSLEASSEQLREALREATRWGQADPLTPPLAKAHVTEAMSSLRCSIDRASGLLGRSDILLATASRPLT